MKNRLARFLVLPLLLLSILISAPASALAQEKASKNAEQELRGIEWRTDIGAARKDAQKDGKPILYYYRCEP